MMKKQLILVLGLSFYTCIYAQTMLTGIANVYSGLLNQNDCFNTIEIDSPLGFTVGMGVVIIQTNGADIQTDNNENFGNITSLNGAGLYEYNRISQIDGQLITLERSLQNTYVAANSQVVGFDIYPDVVIAGEVTAPAWNGNTGGIIVIAAENSIQLLADINANGLGFRGGQPYLASDDNCNFLTNSNNFSYESGNWRGAPKGEGIAAFVNGAESGRGAQANGGGGGNSHNSGGGGGALLTQGGRGGNNEEPSFLGCDGGFPGLGGKVLPNDPSRIFFGGGGGTGHSNNNINTRGGAGGGIIILKSTEVIFNNGSLLANGLPGQSITGDGGGGGGGAGSIFITAATITGNIAISAMGGGGGNADNDGQNRCFGPGGGGSGGLLMSTQALVAQLAGGQAGESLNSTACTGSNGALSGENGVANSSLSTLIQGEEFLVPAFLSNTADTLICEEALLQLLASVQGDNISFQWQYLENVNWIPLTEGIVYSGTQSLELSFLANAGAGGFYRLLATPEDDCFPPFVSPAIAVNIMNLPNATPTFTIDGFDVQFMANASNFTAVNWLLPNGENSSELNPGFSFLAAGSYEVVFTVMNDCGESSSIITIDISTPLNAQISSSSLNGCAPLTVLFSDESTGQVAERIWTFEGGIPASSTESNPLVQFPQAGFFDVSLMLQNANGSVSTSVVISVLTPPLPGFNFEIDGLNVLFNNTSSNAENYSWNFGDGENSIVESPLHTYAASGTYEVTLNASNNSCGAAFSQTIGLNITDTEDLKAALVNVYPNPGTGLFYLESKQQGYCKVYDLNGRLIHDQKINSPLTVLDLGQHPSGLYHLIVNSQEQLFRIRLVKL